MQITAITPLTIIQGHLFWQSQRRPPSNRRPERRPTYFLPSFCVADILSDVKLHSRLFRCFRWDLWAFNFWKRWENKKKR